MTLTLDHLIHAGPDLDRVVKETTRITGVAPTPGGRHPEQGTRNALLGLASGAYLELMAPDPDGRRGDFLASIEHLGAPQLHAWCVRVDDADAFAARVERTGLSVQRLTAGRDAPSGDRLTWELLFPVGHGWGGAAPFFIDWRGSRHPSEGLGHDLRLRLLAVQDPEADDLARWLGDLGIGDRLGEDGPRLEFKSGGRALRGDFVGRRGAFVLRGSGAGMRLVSRTA